jgi:hypothetical protein
MVGKLCSFLIDIEVSQKRENTWTHGSELPVSATTRKVRCFGAFARVTGSFFAIGVSSSFPAEDHRNADFSTFPWLTFRGLGQLGTAPRNMN